MGVELPDEEGDQPQRQQGARHQHVQQHEGAVGCVGPKVRI